MFHTPAHKNVATPGAQLSRLDLIEANIERDRAARDLEAAAASQRIADYYARQDRLMACLGVEAPEWGDRY